MDTTLRAILSPKQSRVSSEIVSARLLAICTGVGGALYGAAMGTYSVIEGGHLVQILFSALKVPLILGLSAGICLPAVFMLYTLQGLQHDFKVALRALLEGQAALAAVLASLGPLTLVLYLSGLTYRNALLLNIGLFALAALAARGVIQSRLKGLVQREPRHRNLLRIWFGLFAFVMVQLAWNLRPFVGNPQAPAEFFRTDAFTNVYMNLIKLAGA